MRSLLRSVKKRKKRRVLGEVEVMSREEYSGLELDSKVEMIRALILGGHFKTGQWWSPQKRPMGMARDSVVLPL